jgi:ATP-binding cassette subfamily B protein
MRAVAAAWGTQSARWRDLVRLLPQAGRAVLAGVIVTAAVDAVLPLAIIATTGRLIERVTATPSVSHVMGPLILLAALFTARQLLDPVRSVLVYRAASRVDGSMRARVMAATTGVPGVALLEDPAMQDLVTQSAARPGPFRPASPGGAAVGMVGLAAKYAQGVGAALLIARFWVWLATAMLVGVALYRRPHHRVNITLVRAFDDHLTSYRRAGYLSGLVVEPPGAKEIRVFGLSRWILDRHTQVWTQVTGSMSALRHRATRQISAYHLLMAPLSLVAFLASGRAALDGRIGVGTLAVVLQASLQLLALGGLGFDEYQIDFGTASLPALAELEDRAAAARAAEPGGGHLVASDQPCQAIRFEDVSFAYPDGRQVFDRLDLTVPAGASLAIVGSNGAGKTTLVKLLARLYEPSSGRILVDGVDLRELDLASWRARLAVIFQDFVRYELGATENVGFGCLSRLDDCDAIRGAARRAGSLAVVEELAGGWDTVLARGYTGGADLSGGEWQRVALARALFAVDGGASILALDEPTANLDVRAEAELFEHLLQLVSPAVGAGARSPVTTLLISHRFSTVRRADRICVLDAGHVVEEGTHDELVRAAGLYARMFSLQASRFDG